MSTTPMANSPYQQPVAHLDDGPGNFAGVGAFRAPPSPHPADRASYLEPGGMHPAPLGSHTPSMYSREPTPPHQPGAPYDPYADHSAQPAFQRDLGPASYNERAPSIIGAPIVPPPAASTMPYAPPAATYAPGEKTPYLRAYERRRKRAWCFFLLILAIIAIVLAVVLPVYFVVIKPKNRSGSGSGSSSSSPSAGPKPTSPASGDSASGGTTGTDAQGNTFIIGTDGTTVKTADGKSFVYKNSFGGYFVQDEKNPYNDGARAQSWSPALNETWVWGVHKVRGVNLGGWFVPEPFIVPTLYQKYMNGGSTVQITGDEWTLSQAMALDSAGGGLNQLENHYKTFITEEDFAQIAGAGLNFVRIPIPFWAVETWDVFGEPFLERTAWGYIVQAFEWARKYGLRVNLDLHTMPGAQNPWNHSGRGGVVNFMSGIMGYANAQRGLGYVRYITEFISQPQYSNVVAMFGIVNEPTADIPALQNFYLHAHDMVRGITGFGTGKGPYISIHDQFKGPASWAGFAAGADRIALEQHPYFAFGAGNAPDIAPFISRPCTDWGPALNESQSAFGVTTAGEWSLGFNDCGLYINGVGDSHATQDCAPWDDWQSYDETRKNQLRQFSMAQMDALPHWFFWTWKIGPDNTGVVKAPLWSYSLGLQEGWIPANPRDADGICVQMGADVTPQQPYAAWQTGGAGAGTLLGPTAVWPPTSMPSVDVPGPTAWPVYTASAPVITMPGLADGGAADGWANAADTAPGVTTVSGCTYPDEYRPGDLLPAVCAAAQTDAVNVAGNGNGLNGLRARAAAPIVTPPPS